MFLSVHILKIRTCIELKQRAVSFLRCNIKIVINTDQNNTFPTLKLQLILLEVRTTHH